MITAAHSDDRVVVFVDFPSDPPPPGPEEDSWWSRAAGAGVEATPGKTLAAIRPLPARRSPRPVRVVARRFARSEFAADLRDWGWLIGLLAAGVLCAGVFDQQFTDLVHAIHTHLTAGGTR